MFKVGQTVWCIQFGKLKIVKTGLKNTQYPVVAEDSTGVRHSYTSNGRLFADRLQRNLYFSEPQITAKTEPPFESTMKKGDVVVVVSVATGEAILVIKVLQEKEDHVISTSLIHYCKSEYHFYKKGDKIC